MKKEELAKNINYFRGLIREIENKVINIANEHCQDIDFNSMWHKIGYWSCEKSPIGICVYNYI